jgi:hypothetical protein
MIKPCVECKEDFEFKTHNQKYCSQQCCRISTNKRIMEKYYAKKERLSGSTRLCSCGSKLSRYSPDLICTLCYQKNKKNKTVDALEVVKNAAIKTAKTKSR